MKLSELNGITVCETLSGIIEEALQEINVKSYITYPEIGLPDAFTVTEPYGGMTDLGDMAEGMIVMDICVKLLKDRRVNNIKMTKILEVINKVIPSRGVRKDNYFFVLNTSNNYTDEIDYSLGFAVKSLNIFYRVEKKRNINQ